MHQMHKNIFFSRARSKIEGSDSFDFKASLFVKKTVSKPQSISWLIVDFISIGQRYFNHLMFGFRVSVTRFKNHGGICHRFIERGGFSLRQIKQNVFFLSSLITFALFPLLVQLSSADTHSSLLPLCLWKMRF